MFTNSPAGRRIIKTFAKVEYPKLPFKRSLTEEEIKVMYKYFRNYSWSAVDANGNVILCGWKFNVGMCYITEQDLMALTSLRRNAPQ